MQYYCIVKIIGSVLVVKKVHKSIGLLLSFENLHLSVLLSNLAISLSDQMLTQAASNWKKKESALILADCLVQQKLLFVNCMNAFIPVLQMTRHCTNYVQSQSESLQLVQFVRETDDLT